MYCGQETFLIFLEESNSKELKNSQPYCIQNKKAKTLHKNIWKIPILQMPSCNKPCGQSERDGPGKTELGSVFQNRDWF